MAGFDEERGIAGGGELDIVRDEYQRRAVRAVHFEHQIDHRVTGGRVETAGGLVGEENRRMRDERAGQRHALLLTARQQLRIMRGALVETDLFEQCPRAGRRVARRHAALQLERQHHVFERGQMRHQLERLEHEADRTATQRGAFVFIEFGEDERAALRSGSVGFVFQSFQLMPHLTALENVMLPLELQGGMSSRDAATRARTLLEQVGLDKRTAHYPKLLSGGEQQRVALARAFVTHPAILFADEPTGSLDAATGYAIIDLMFEMNRRNGATLILVTHDAELAERCDATVTIEAGRLVNGLSV